MDYVHRNYFGYVGKKIQTRKETGRVGDLYDFIREIIDRRSNMNAQPLGLLMKEYTLFKLHSEG
jgi:hypothetical protein